MHHGNVVGHLTYNWGSPVRLWYMVKGNGEYAVMMLCVMSFFTLFQSIMLAVEENNTAQLTTTCIQVMSSILILNKDHPHMYLSPEFISTTVHHPNAAHYAGAAAEAGQIEKDGHHNDFVKATGGIFHPMVIETFGLLQTLLEVLPCKEISMSKATTNLHEQLSVTLWLYNAKMILHTVD